jgi:hypothetical protein
MRCQSVLPFLKSHQSLTCRSTQPTHKFKHVSVRSPYSPTKKLVAERIEIFQPTQRTRLFFLCSWSLDVNSLRFYAAAGTLHFLQ